MTKPACPVLFFVRGRGRAHAAVAHSVLQALESKRFSFPVVLASYAAGADALREMGRPVIDLALPERNSLVDVFVPAGELIRKLRPRLVVAHEEFAVPPAARILEIPSAFLIDWFGDPSLSTMRALDHANEILYIDEPGIFEEPPYLKGRIRYTGPVLRRFTRNPTDRPHARQELDISEQELVLGVFVHPGRRDETVAPICEILLPALDLIGTPARVVWHGDADEVLTAKLRRRAGVTVYGADTPFDQLMVACDVGITKGNRNIALELASLGVPSISLSHGLNRIDDIRTSRVPGNTTLAASRLTAAGLAGRIREKAQCRKGGAQGFPPVAFRDGAEAFARRLIEIADGSPLGEVAPGG